MSKIINNTTCYVSSHVLIINLLKITGAHSHIRGLGLDDALEPRPVRILLLLIIIIIVFLTTVCMLTGVSRHGRSRCSKEGCWHHTGDGQGTINLSYCSQ